MIFENLLAAGIDVFPGGFGSVSINWIGKIIRGIITFAGDIGFGIILFTLILKLITLGPDIWSRVSMKKNSLKMELMKDDLEKLQKQYANNQQLYQQKMMALYKKNGYSMFSACLPSIITLVLFIIVINAFTAYSNFMNKEVYNEMGVAYTAEVEKYAEDGTVYLSDDTNTAHYDVDINKVLKDSGYYVWFTEGYADGEKNADEKKYVADKNKYGEIVEKYPALKEYLNESLEFNRENKELLQNIDAEFRAKLINLKGITELEEKGLIKYDDNGNADIKDVYAFFTEYKEDAEVNKYFDYEKGEVDYTAVFAEFSDIEVKFETSAEKYFGEKTAAAIANEKLAEVREAARNAAKEVFVNTRQNKSYITPWIKNIWVADSPMNSAIPSNSDISKNLRNAVGTLNSESYSEITANLSEYKEKGFKNGNGWLILIILSIGTMFASQFIMQRAQKTQTQLATVDGANGQAAMTQKMMTWMMPIMFGVFAFLYSASFSIYMITSSLLSLISTVLINYFVSLRFKSKIKKDFKEKNSKAKYGKPRF
ncbi:MAG TPA: hypothetical protein DDW54_04530 [Clostridiales bacterium]|nr:hypothetical protein [Clostridiales bacterium]